MHWNNLPLSRMKNLVSVMLLLSVFFAAMRPSLALVPQLILQTGHAGAVMDLAFSPDGKIIASAGADNIKLWDVSSGQELRSLAGDVGPLAFSPDSKMLVTGGPDNSLKLWDVASGKQLRSFIGHSDMVLAATFSLDGKTLVTADEPTTKVWDVATGKQLRSFDLHSDRVRNIAFSMDGKTIAFDNKGNSIFLWDVATGKPLRSLVGHKDYTSEIAFSNDGKMVATSSWDKTIKLWDSASGKELYSFDGGSLPASKLLFARDDKTLLLASGNRAVVKVWNIAAKKEVSTLAGHTDEIFTIAVSPDGKMIATGGADKTIREWEVPSGKEIRTIAATSFPVHRIAVSRDDSTLATCGLYDKTIRVWDLASGQGMRSLTVQSSWVSSVAISPDKQTFLSGSEDGILKIWDLASGKELRSWTGHSDSAAPYLVSVNSVAFSPDGKTIASGSQNKSIKLWDAASGKELHNLAGHTDAVRNVVFSPDGKTLFSGSWDHTVRFWDVASGKAIRSIPAHTEWVDSLAVSPDGKTLVSGSWKEIKLWDVASAKELRRIACHTQMVSSVAFSRDGTKLVTGSSDNAMKVWDLKSGTLTRTLTDPAVSALFCRNDKFIVSGGGDSSVRVWNLGTGTVWASLCPIGKSDWAVTTREGRFDASDGGMEAMHYNVGNEVVRLEQFKERYYEPGLVGKLTGFSKEPLRDISGFDKIELYPKVSCEMAPDNKSLQIKMRNQGGGIGKVIVKVNGKQFDIDPNAMPRDLNKTSQQASLTIDLSKATSVVAGKANEISVAAYNADEHLVSRDVGIAWTPKGAARTEPPEVYAIIGGVSEYSDPSKKLNLGYAAKDACDFAKALELGAKRLFGAEKVHTTLLTTAKVPNAHPPTKAEFIKAFENAKKAKPNDILIVYLSGHGTTAKQGADTYCYLTSDAFTTDFTDPEIRKKTAITSNEILDWTKADAIPALKQVLILDTCAAGALADRLSDRKDIAGDQIRAIERLKDRTGFHVLMGCTSDAVSYEASKFGQGLLTHALLEGMRGPALIEERTEKLVDVQKLFQYAAELVPQLAKGIGGVQKPEISVPKGISFWIGKLTREDMSAIPVAAEKPIILKPFLMGARRDDLNLTAALKAKLYDDLSPATRGGANARTIRAVYLAADEMVGAYIPTGSYHEEGGQVVVKMAVTKDDKEVANFEVSGPKDAPSELASRMAQKIYSAIGAN